MADALDITQNYNIDVILPDLMWDELYDTGDDALLDAIPIVHEKEDLLIWEQHENGYGLLSLRGLGGQPDIVNHPGKRKYAVAPGYYGERCEYDETQMTKGRQIGTPNLPETKGERIGILAQYTAGRVVTRIRQTLADFLRTGVFVNRSSTGAAIHTDQIENYTSITSMGGYTLPKTGLSLGPSWRSDPANARPLQDLDRIKLELEFGTSSKFGRDAMILCNPDVLVDLLATNDVRNTYRSDYGASIASEVDLGKLFLGRNLAKLVPYDKGYYPLITDAVARTNFTRIIPTRSMIFIGTRPKGQKLGQFVLTNNLGVNPPEGTSDSPYKAKSSRDGMGWVEGIHVLLEYYPKMPFRYELDVALNGGPRIHFGSSAAGMTY